MAGKQKHLSTEERKQRIHEQAEMAGLDPTEIAKLTILAEMMKAPTAKEQMEIDRERDLLMQTLQDQEQQAKNKREHQLRYQGYCQHQNPASKKLSVSGQIIGPDNYRVAIVRCNEPQCGKVWMWKATDEEKQQGLCLNDDPIRPRFANKDQLDLQESLLPIDPKFARKLGYRLVAERHEKYAQEAK